MLWRAMMYAVIAAILTLSTLASAGERVTGVATAVPVSVVRDAIAAQLPDYGDDSVKLLTAHVMHEGGERGGLVRGWNYNMFGIKATGSAPYMLLWATECRYRVCRRVKQRFRSYSSSSVAIAAYVGVMRSSFPASLEVAKSGNIRSFALSLRREKYYTGSLGGYISSLKRKIGRVK